MYGAEEQILVPVFMKHYAPNICVHLKMAKFAKGHNSRFFFTEFVQKLFI